MKKMIVLVLCAIIAYSLSIVVHSSSNEYSGDVYAETEFQEVKAFSEEFSKLTDDFPKNEVHIGYKLYALDPGVFSNLITSNLPLKELALSEQQGWDYPYSWIIRLGDINYCVVNRVRNAWEMTSFTMAKYPDILEGLPKGCEWAVGLVDFDIVQDALRKIESCGETLTGEQLIFTTGMTNTTFFAFRSNKDTYLITFPWRPDLTGLQSGKCYSAQEVKDILDRTYPVIYADDMTEGEQIAAGGNVSLYKRSDFNNITGWPPEERTAKTWQFILGAGTLIVVIFIIRYIIKRQRRS